MKQSIVNEKSKHFAIRVVRLYQYLTETTPRKEYVLSRQMLRSGTSIGANVKEALRGQSVADFTARMSIALKEASETEYWLELLGETGYLDERLSVSMLDDCRELIRMLMSIVKSTNKL